MHDNLHVQPSDRHPLTPRTQGSGLRQEAQQSSAPPQKTHLRDKGKTRKKSRHHHPGVWGQVGESHAELPNSSQHP